MTEGTTKRHRAYKLGLQERYWRFWEAHFRSDEGLLEPKRGPQGRPPVLRREHRGRNVLSSPGNPETSKAVLGEVGPKDRHRWFGSFHSSQALAQSVFANLKHHDKLGVLIGIRDDEGRAIFFDDTPAPDDMSMEHRINHLGEKEGRSTEVDVFFGGDHRVCVECKFTEDGVGGCSRPKMRASDSRYDQQFCDGSYTVQRGRTQRCALSEIGIRYWKYLDELLGWHSDHDHSKCPLRVPYQLVRNILGACVDRDGNLDVGSGHAVLVYDERNPQFQPDGSGFDAYSGSVKQLRHRGVLRRCSWQRIVSALETDSDLQWLVNGLEAKYGLRGL